VQILLVNEFIKITFQEFKMSAMVTVR